MINLHITVDTLATRKFYKDKRVKWYITFFICLSVSYFSHILINITMKEIKKQI